MASAAWLLPDKDLHELYNGDYTYGRYPMSAGQLVRVLHHAIRTNKPEEAHQAAARLLISNHSDLLCEQLVLFSVTDVGLANLEAVVLCVRTLNLYYRLCHEECGEQIITLSTGYKTKLWRRELRNHCNLRKAVALCVDSLCHSPKSRECMHASVVYFSGPGRPQPRFAWPKSANIPIGEERTLLEAFANGVGTKFEVKALEAFFQPFHMTPATTALRNGLRMLNVPGQQWKGRVLLACAALVFGRSPTQYNFSVGTPVRKQYIEEEVAKQLYTRLQHQPDLLAPLVEPDKVTTPAMALEQAERSITPRFHQSVDPYYQQALEHCTKTT